MSQWINESITLTLSFNSERRIRTRRLQSDLFKVIDGRVARTGGQFTFEGFHTLRRSFDQSLDATVFEITNEAHHLMTRGRALGEETKTHTLHFATDEEPARYSRHLDSKSI